MQVCHDLRGSSSWSRDRTSPSKVGRSRYAALSDAFAATGRSQSDLIFRQYGAHASLYRAAIAIKAPMESLLRLRRASFMPAFKVAELWLACWEAGLSTPRRGYGTLSRPVRTKPCWSPTTLRPPRGQSGSAAFPSGTAKALCAQACRSLQTCKLVAVQCLARVGAVRATLAPVCSRSQRVGFMAVQLS